MIALLTKIAGSFSRCLLLADTAALCDTVKNNMSDLAAKLFSLTLRRSTMNMNIAIEPILAIVVGVLILLVPRFLNYFVAVYLIVVGILGG